MLNHKVPIFIGFTQNGVKTEKKSSTDLPPYRSVIILCFLTYCYFTSFYMAITILIFPYMLFYQRNVISTQLLAIQIALNRENNIRFKSLQKIQYTHLLLSFSFCIRVCFLFSFFLFFAQNKVTSTSYLKNRVIVIHFFVSNHILQIELTFNHIDSNHLFFIIITSISIKFLDF